MFSAFTAFFIIGIIILLGKSIPTTTQIEESPLIHGKITHTPGDLITERLYFMAPLSSSQIKWLNTVLIKPIINYWSLTHLVWGVFAKLTGLSLSNTIILHTIFEIWETWSFGYFSDIPFTPVEAADIILDTLFTILGYIWTQLSPFTSIAFAASFMVKLFSQ